MALLFFFAMVFSSYGKEDKITKLLFFLIYDSQNARPILHL